MEDALFEISTAIYATFPSQVGDLWVGFLILGTR